MNIAVDGYGLHTTRPNVATMGYGYGVLVVGRLIDRYTPGPIPLDTLVRGGGSRGGVALSSTTRRRRR